MTRTSLKPSSTRQIVDSVDIVLPLCPSSNALFANRASGGRFKTKVYQKWINEAGWRLMAQHPGRIDGVYDLAIVVSGLRRGADVENRMKAVSDLLTRHSVVFDDSLARSVSIVRSEGQEAGMRVIVRKALRPGEACDAPSSRA
jgi:Holliday junction resolvase RusA-like endonuclease